MKHFMQSVNSCMQCRNSIKRSLDVNYCGAQPGTLAKMEKIYMQNKDGLTETCPKWPEAVEVAE
jgi:hypothetical protein